MLVAEPAQLGLSWGFLGHFSLQLAYPILMFDPNWIVSSAYAVMNFLEPITTKFGRYLLNITLGAQSFPSHSPLMQSTKKGVCYIQCGVWERRLGSRKGSYFPLLLHKPTTHQWVSSGPCQLISWHNPRRGKQPQKREDRIWCGPLLPDSHLPLLPILPLPI